MKSTLNQKRLLLIGIIIILIFVLVIFLKKQTDTSFNQIKLSEKNIISNRANQNYLDTIVSVGLDELNIQKILVVIKPITQEIRNQLNKKESELDVKAFIIGKNNQYTSYENWSVDAIESLLKYGFGSLGLNKIWMELYSHDNKKIEVFKNEFKFKVDGVFRDNHIINGVYSDSFLLTLLAKEYYNTEGIKNGQ